MSLSVILKQGLPLRNKPIENYLVDREVGRPGKEMNAFQYSFAKNPGGRAVPTSSTKAFDDW